MKLKWIVGILVLCASAQAQDNKLFITLEGLRYGSAIADAETTVRFNPRRCSEGFPLLRGQPTRRDVYSVGIPIEVGVSVGNYFLQRYMRRHSTKDDRTAALIMGEVPETAIHAYLAYHNRACF